MSRRPPPRGLFHERVSPPPGSPRARSEATVHRLEIPKARYRHNWIGFRGWLSHRVKRTGAALADWIQP